MSPEKPAKKAPRDLVRPHVADGIAEYDNPLPGWWIGFLYGSVVFSVVYLVAYHLIGWASLEESYASARRAERAGAATAVNAAGVVAGNLDARLHDAASVTAGAAVFSTYCAPCHGAGGEGNIGPNLTDDYWLHGGAAAAIVATIAAGVPEKGMPGWGPVLGDHKVEQAAAYVLTLHGTKPPNPKAPQGELSK